MNDDNIKINVDLKNSCILIVDDEKANIILLDRLLKLKGYTNLVSTQDPTDVTKLYKMHNCDLILLDIDMPVLDGFGVLKELNNLSNVNLPPILILTAQHAQSFRQRALDAGARDYVTKPFDVEELASRVRNLLDVQMAHKYMHHQNEILEQKVRQRTKEIQDTRLQVVHRLGRAAEFRDNETGLHIIRMSQMAEVIAEASGFDEEQCDLLLNAAPMHDIGKIGIPDHILLKPGKFDPDEWEIMKSHAQIGADILSGDDSKLMTLAYDIAISHHEKWNGKGYPNNLVGDSIPLVGRITAIADVFDALTSKRPYKKAWSVDDSVKLITEESGKHFDPILVKLFLKNLPKIITIKEKYAEPEDV